MSHVNSFIRLKRKKYKHCVYLFRLNRKEEKEALFSVVIKGGGGGNN
jgi:hypothetical protein